MRPTALAKAAALCALALTGYVLAAPPKAQAYNVTDLSNLGYSVLSDNKGNGCIAWSAGIPGFNRTLIGQDCWPTFQILLDNYINQTLPALQAYQAAHPTTPSTAVYTTTVTKTIYDSAGGTFTITVTNPGATTTETVTAPAETRTETHTTYLTVPGPTVTLPGPILDHYITVTRTVESPPPAPITVVETQTETTIETQTVEHTRTITVVRPAAKPKMTRQRALRTG